MEKREVVRCSAVFRSRFSPHNLGFLSLLLTYRVRRHTRHPLNHTHTMAATADAPPAPPLAPTGATGDEPVPVVSSVDAVYGEGECAMEEGNGTRVLVTQSRRTGGERRGGRRAFLRRKMASSSSPPPLPPDAAPSQAAVFASLKALSQDVHGVPPDVYARSPGELCVGGGTEERAQRWRCQPPRVLPSRRAATHRPAPQLAPPIQDWAGGQCWGGGRATGQLSQRASAGGDRHAFLFNLPTLPQAASTTSANTSTMKATTSCPPPSCRTPKSASRGWQARTTSSLPTLTAGATPI